MASPSSRRTATATFTRSTAQPEPEINVTPLVDVVLVLLIIFMVIAPNLQEGTPVVLPEVKTADEKAHEDVIEIVLTLDGRTLLDEKELDHDALLAEVARLRGVHPDRILILKADAALPYAKVRDVFASLQQHGFKGVSLKVTTREKEAS